MLDLDARVVGTEFRGATQIAALRFLASAGGHPIGMIDCGVFDRWVDYDGEGSNGPIIRAVRPVTTGSIAFVVDPASRRKGIGLAMIACLLARSELTGVQLIEAGVDPDNIASMRCLAAAGFQQHRLDPDFEGMLYFLLSR